MSVTRPRLVGRGRDVRLAPFAAETYRARPPPDRAAPARATRLTAVAGDQRASDRARLVVR